LKNQSAGANLPELILNFREQAKDTLFLIEEFAAAIDPSIEKNTDPLNTTAQHLLQDLMAGGT
jgi:hypothetical protein